MAIDIKTLACPACGSPEVEMVSEERGVCKSCGVQFAVHPQDIIVNGGSYKDEENNKIRIVHIAPKYSKEEFIEKAWITLAKERAPIEVFKKDFGEVSVVEHEILDEFVEESGTYTADIGYFKDEVYTEYEKYYEKVPYQTTEKYYDSAIGGTRDRLVTKYRNEERQRPVTRHRTVTEWKPFNGSYNESAVALAENNSTYLDKYAFVESRSGMSEDEESDVSECSIETINISIEAIREIVEQHCNMIKSKVRTGLPGNTSQNLILSFDTSTTIMSNLYRTVEYVASIEINGKKYTKRAFPFGNMYISGDKIDNDEDPHAVQESMRKEQSKRAENSRSNLRERVWEKIKKDFFIAATLFVLSMLTSCFISVTFLVVLLYLMATAFGAYSLLKIKKTAEEERKKICSEIEADRKNTENDIANYHETYLKRECAALNAKLQSMGFKPVDEKELNWDKEKFDPDGKGFGWNDEESGWDDEEMEYRILNGL